MASEGHILRPTGGCSVDYHSILGANDPSPDHIAPPQPLHNNGEPGGDAGIQDNTAGQNPVDPSNQQAGSDANQISDPEKLKEHEKALRLKLYGYFYKLKELVCDGGMVDWPTPINTLGQYSLQQLEELYEQVKVAVAVCSQGVGVFMHNAGCQFVETMGISAGFKFNGFAEEMRLQTMAKNLQDRVRQLVTILEIEYALGFRNPLIEYATLMTGCAMDRHRRLEAEDANLFFEAQQYEAVPPDMVNDFSHL